MKRNFNSSNVQVGAGALAAVLFGGAAVGTLYNSFYNVEGGHAAIVFNRFVGVKVRSLELEKFFFFFFLPYFFFFFFLEQGLWRRNTLYGSLD